MLTLLLAAALAAPDPPTLAQIQARLEEVAPWRVHRQAKGAPRLPVSVWEKVAAGKVVTGLIEVEGQAAKKAWGVGLVAAPIDRLWAAVNDDRSKAAYTGLDYAEVTSGAYCDAPRTVFQYLPVPLFTNRWWVIDVNYSAPLVAASGGTVREQRWKSTDKAPGSATATEWADKGMRVTYTEGSWLLIQLDEAHTLIEYYTFADPGGSVPAGFASKLAAGGIEDTFAAMQKLAAAGPTCKPW